MQLPDLAELDRAGELVHRVIAPTPQFAWPLLAERCGCEVWVKHENHTPVGAFKVRGGLTYMTWLRTHHPEVKAVVAATRGNHGQSVAFAARRLGLKATIVVPHGNSVEKNAAMRALGAELVEHGHDFQAAFEHATTLAEATSAHLLPSFHRLLVAGVGTYAMEFLRAVPDLDTVYVPIGLGSGISGMIAARNALGLKTEIVGVVAKNAPAYALSFKAHEPVATNTADTLADGLACRVPVPDALSVIIKGATRIVQVSDEEIAEAMRIYFSDTHNVAEGAGAASLAALLQEGARGRARCGVVLGGGNVDSAIYSSILAGS